MGDGGGIGGVTVVLGLRGSDSLLLHCHWRQGPPCYENLNVARTLFHSMLLSNTVSRNSMVVCVSLC